MTRVETGLGHVELLPYKRRLSHSQITTLHPDNQWSCPRQWSYSTLMKLPRHPSAAICVGRMLDEAATRFWIEVGEEHDFTTSVMAAESAAHYEGSQCEWPTGEDIGAKKQSAIDAVEELCRFLNMRCEPPLAFGMQLTHEFTVRASDGELVTISGRSDWIESVVGRVAVVDLKTTGTRRWDKNDVPDEDWLRRCHEQVTVYRLGLAATGLPDGTAVPIDGPGVVIAACVSTRRKEPVFARFDFDVTQADADRVLARIVESDELARQATHPARPGDACSFCPFVERCRSDMDRLVRPDGEVAA